MAIQFSGVTFVSGDLAKVKKRVETLAAKKGIAMSDAFEYQGSNPSEGRGVVVDGEDARLFLEREFDLLLPKKPFILTKKTYESDAKHRESLKDLWEAMDAEGVPDLNESRLVSRMYDWALQRLEDSIDVSGKPVKEETV